MSYCSTDPQQVNHRRRARKFLRIVTLRRSKNPDRLHGPQHFCIFATPSALLQWKIRNEGNQLMSIYFHLNIKMQMRRPEDSGILLLFEGSAACEQPTEFTKKRRIKPQ
jgi:hypothetical protein